MKPMIPLTIVSFALVALTFPSSLLGQESRRRVLDCGIRIGTLPRPPLNAITDIEGVRVGHATIHEGDRFHTGVTAIIPHKQNTFRSRVPAAVVVGNGFGKLVGALQVQELGELETPILLTGTLSVWRAADAMVTFMLKLPGMEKVRSINPVVGETNDGRLSDIRARPIGEKEVFRALQSARTGRVEEGSVGAGAGCVCFGYKGGIGTASRYTSATKDRWTVGVLVQSNFGGALTVDGVPVGRHLKRSSKGNGDGSCMIVVATDAPIGSRNLKRLSKRALLGLARTGSIMSNGSGDFVIAFSTHPSQRRKNRRDPRPSRVDIPNAQMTPLFQAVVECVEEAVLNSLFMAKPVTGQGKTVPSLPVDRVLKIMMKNQ